MCMRVCVHARACSPPRYFHNKIDLYLTGLLMLSQCIRKIVTEHHRRPPNLAEVNWLFYFSACSCSQYTRQTIRDHHQSNWMFAHDHHRNNWLCACSQYIKQIIRARLRTPQKSVCDPVTVGKWLYDQSLRSAGNAQIKKCNVLVYVGFHAVSFSFFAGRGQSECPKGLQSGLGFRLTLEAEH